MFDAEKLVVLLNNPSPSIRIIILKVCMINDISLKCFILFQTNIFCFRS